MDSATPFFISLVDADGSMWAYGPLHARVGGALDCLVGSATSQSVPYNLAILTSVLVFTSYFRASKTVKPAITIGVGLGVFVLGSLGAWLLLNGRYKKIKPASDALPSRVPSPHGSPLDIDDSQEANVMRQPTSSLRVLAPPMEYQVDPFAVPGKSHTGHVYGPQSHTPEYTLIQDPTLCWGMSDPYANGN